MLKMKQIIIIIPMFILLINITGAVRTIISPVNYTTDIQLNINFSINISGDYNLSNATLWHNLNGTWSPNGTIDVSGSSTTVSWITNFANFFTNMIRDKVYVWDVGWSNSTGYGQETPVIIWSNNATFTGWELGLLTNTYINSSNTTGTGQLKLQSGYGLGSYSSNVKDAGKLVVWSNISVWWIEQSGYGWINLSVRSCDDIACDTEPWQDNFTLDSEPFSQTVLTIPDNRYFQYNLTFNSTDSSSSPEVYNVTIGYTVDTQAPLWSNNATNITSKVEYNPLRHYQFNITWDESDPHVILEHNFTGYGSLNLTNITMSSSNASAYQYNHTQLAAGHHFWRSYANDTSNNLNQSDSFIFEIARNTTACVISINVTSPITKGVHYNVSCDCGFEPVETLWVNGTQITNGITNTTAPSAHYNYTCNSSMTDNYTYSQDTTELIITEPPSLFCPYFAIENTDENYLFSVNTCTGNTNISGNTQISKNLNVLGDTYFSGSLNATTIISGNLTMQSPSGTWYNCGPNNLGEWECN